MQRHGIPTAGYADVHATPPRRTPTSTQRGAPIVVKADGLAAGKGVVVAHDARRSARGRSTRCCSTTVWAARGARVVIEEFLDGEEASFIVMCDGSNVLALATSQDHKRLLRRRHAARTPAAWAPIRRRRWSRRTCTPA